MDLKSFADKIKKLSEEGRIGVSNRIELFDKGKLLGLTRSAVDKMIDEALKEARQASRSSKPGRTTSPKTNQTTDHLTVEEGHSKKPADAAKESGSDPDSEQTTTDLDGWKLKQGSSSGGEEFINDVKEEIEQKAPTPEDDPFAPPIRTDRYDQAEKKAAESLERMLDAIKTESQQVQKDISFQEAIAETEAVFDEVIESDWIPEDSNDPENEMEHQPGDLRTPKQMEGEVPLSEGLLALIAGGVSIIACSTLLGIMAAIAGFVFVRMGNHKINQHGTSYYLRQHLNFLNMGQVLTWIGVGLFIFVYFILHRFA